MWKTKFFYELKLFIVTALIILQISMVEMAPDYPILFVLLTGTNIIVTRLIWCSAMKDEKIINKSRKRAEQNNIQHLSHQREIARTVTEYKKRAS